MKNVPVSLVSLGCAKNFADAEAFFSLLPEVVLANECDAEVVFLNTCGFLKAARDEVFENLDRLHDKKVIVTGCLASRFSVADFEKYDQLFGVVSSANYDSMPEIFEAVRRGEKIHAVADEPVCFEEIFGKTLLQTKPYAYVKIAEGCNNRCSYCLIPSLKGKYRSRDAKSIVDEVKNLVEIGVKEVILVAQDCGCYEGGLAKLLAKLERIKGDFWIRVLYIYPERINDELLRVMAKSKKICHYLDVPLQHGDSGILKAMRRPADVDAVLRKIARIREVLPDVTLRTSFIVGFPGESEKAFSELVRFVKKIEFDHVGVFEYSREKGTPAYDLPKQVPYRVKRARRKKLMAVQEKISARKNREWVGRTVRVLIDGVGVGRSARFAPDVDGVIYVENGVPNQFCEVKITGSDSYDLSGCSAVG